jgi:hypothetical protein
MFVRFGDGLWASSSERMPSLSSALEELHGSLMLFSRSARGKRTEVSPFASFGIALAGIQAITPVVQLANHVRTSHLIIRRSEAAGETAGFDAVGLGPLLSRRG